MTPVIKQKNSSRERFSHWLWLVPVILIYAAFAFRQIDLYPPSVDEFRSLLHAGWLEESPKTLAAVVASLQLRSPDQSPAYYLMLSAWGHLVPLEIAMARVLSLFAGILALAIMYRLAHDFVAPVAALVAVILLAGNAYFNWYVVFARVYPLNVCVAGFGLWVYLHMMYRANKVKRAHYLALFACFFIFSNLHIFNVQLVLILGAYHLLFAPKNRCWAGITLTVVAAHVLFLSYALAMIQGLAFAISRKIVPERQLSAAAAVLHWLTLITNGVPLLALLPGIGYILGLRNRIKIAWFWLALCAMFVGSLAAIAHVSTFITDGVLRYYLETLLPAVCMLLAGLLAFRQSRKLLLVVAVLWCVAGIRWQRSADWRYIIYDRYIITQRPTTQLVSRIALQAQPKPAFIMYYDEYSYTHLLTFVGNNRLWDGYELSQAKHYFLQHDVDVLALEDAHALKFQDIDTARGIWIVYRRPKMTGETQMQIDKVMNSVDYQPCETLSLSNDTVVVQYSWRPLNCQLAD